MRTNKYLPFFSLLIFCLLSTATAVNLSNMTVTSGKTFNLNSNEISTSGSVSIQSGGNCNLKGNTIYLHPGFEAYTGSNFTASSAWDQKLIVPTTTEEFKATEVLDARHEARCQNFADNGATFIFKIINGKVYYSRNDIFMGEFSLNDAKTSAVFKDYVNSRAGTERPADLFTMVAADNNRVIAKGSNKDLYWASMITEYKNDYFNYNGGGAYNSVKGCYAKVDPDEGNGSNPTFWGDPNGHYSTLAFKDDSPITVADVKNYSLNNSLNLSKISFTAKKPILSTVTTTTYPPTSYCTETGPILGDLMQVVVDPCRWHLIDATPPRNYTNGNKDELEAPTGSKSYEERKRVIFKELFAYMNKIGKKMMDSGPTGQTDGDKICAVLRAFIATSKDDYLNANPDKKFQNWLSGANYWGHESALTNLTNGICNNVTPANFKLILDKIEKYYNTNIDFALLNGYRQDVFTTSTDALATDLWDILTNGINLSIFDQDQRATLRNNVSYFSDCISYSLNNLDPSSFCVAPAATAYLPQMSAPDVHMPDTTWTWKEAATQFHNWYTYFKYPGNKFVMEDKQPYKIASSIDNNKTLIKIDSIIDIGVCTNSRYEHLRMHNGGELGAFFGDIDNKPEKYDPVVPGTDQSPSTTADGHGFVDGTCNFFMLAQITMKNPDGSPYPAKAVLWLDEQEYFSERWRVLDPRDGAFEGLMGTMSNAFSVLTWFNGYNKFDSTYWTPYQSLTENARMANSRYATVIADDVVIYSTSFFWALTDKTWRWRNYPSINTSIGEAIDKKSIGMRDDQTLYLKGKKVVNGEMIEGYWYQRVLPADNKKTGDPLYEIGTGKPKRPQFGYAHTWNFMATDAFDVASNKHFRMGMYETTDTSTSLYQHYKYKGYNPHTHIYKINPLAPDFNKMPDGVSVTVNWDSLWRNVENTDSARWVPGIHPMYSTMPGNCQYAIMAKFITVGNERFLVYTDPRDDDFKLPNKFVWRDVSLHNPSSNCYGLMLNNPLPGAWIDTGVAISSAPVKGAFGQCLSTRIDTVISYGSYGVDGLCKMSYVTEKWITTVTAYPNIKFYNGQNNNEIWLSSKDLTDLNVWRDLPIDGVTITHNVGANTITCSFNLPTLEMDKYRLKSLKIGYIENGVAQVLCSIPLTTTATNQNITGSLLSTLWDKYLSTESARIKYGVNSWIDEAFGNGNVFSKMTVVP